MKTKILAVLEVLLVTFVIFLAANLLARTPLREWQVTHLHYVFHGHALFILLPIAWLLLTRRSLDAYGITLRRVKADATAAMSVFFPMALAGASLGFLAFTQWHGALLESLIQIALLFAVAHLLNKKPDPQSGLITIGLALLLFGAYSWWQGLFPGLSKSLASLVYYLIFIGFGEEILYRGFILTRLNAAFDRPRRFYGVAWGWGAVLASLIFGFTHVLNGINLETGEFNLLWWWGVWTFFGGFVFTYVREKTGSIVAPAIIHGLPQALVMMLITSF